MMGSYKELDVTPLILAAREHNDGAFVELVERYTPMIKKLCASFSDSSVSYDELFSESCVAFHRAVCSFRLDQSDVTFGLYAQICVRHHLFDVMKAQSITAECYSDVDVDRLAVGAGIDLRLERKENFDNIMKIARDLLTDYEYTVLIYHIQGYKTREIAKCLDKDAKSIDNAKNRLFRRLRNVLTGKADN